MKWVIMRSDLSSMLHEGGKVLVFTNIDVAERYAKPYCGLVVPEKIAEVIMKLFKPITIKEAIGSINKIRETAINELHKLGLGPGVNTAIVEINEITIKETSRLMQLSGNGIHGNILGGGLERNGESE